MIPRALSAGDTNIPTSPSRLPAATSHVSLSCEPKVPTPGILGGVTYSDNLGHAASIKIMPNHAHDIP